MRRRERPFTSAKEFPSPQWLRAMIQPEPIGCCAEFDISGMDYRKTTSPLRYSMGTEVSRITCSSARGVTEKNPNNP
jgi:hypothetical protein